MRDNFVKWGGIILCVLFIGIIVLLLPKLQADNGETGGTALSIDPDARTAEHIEKSVEKGGKGGIAIPGWGSIRIEADKTEVSVNLLNPTENQDKYNLTFSITIDGDERPIAVTGLIPPGQSALKLKLERALPAGEYEASILVQPYRIADGSAANNAEIRTLIIAE